MSRILVIEDNPDLAFGLQSNLEFEGHEVEVCEDGADGLERVRDGAPDLVVLDVMLPGMDGYRILRSLREAGIDVPVLILTARGEEADKVRGFRMGADDYVTKPFGLPELLARVEALLRRSRGGAGGGADTDARLVFGSVEVDTSIRSVRRNGDDVLLTPKEFDLLVALLQRNGKLASRIELMGEVWGHRAAVMSRTVDTHVAELRRKLEQNPASPKHILTVRKAGYRLER